MKNTQSKTAPIALAATAVSAAQATDANEVKGLVEKIKSTDDKIRGPAWQGAGTYGAPAVKPLTAVMTEPDFEIARSAKRAVWKIVRHVGRPGADAERKAVETELIDLLPKGPAAVQRELVWMLSEIGGEPAVQPLAALLANQEVREDARCALERIPGAKSLQALKQALKTAPEDYLPNIAHSLRVRGEKVAGYPTQKLVPTRQTTVKQATTG